MAQVKVSPVGVIDQNTDIKYIGNGNYTDAENIRHRDKDVINTDNNPYLIKGNTLSFTIPDITAQVKKHRIYLAVTSNYTGGSIPVLNGVNDVVIVDNVGRYTGTVSVNINDGLIQLRDDVLADLNAINPGTFNNVTTGGIVVTNYKISTNAGAIRNISGVNTGTEQITISTSFSYGPGVLTGDRIKYTTAGTVIGGLTNGSLYYIRVISGIVFTLHPTRADALANTNIINLTSAGVGTQTITRVEELEGYFDIQDSGVLDESYKIYTQSVGTSPNAFVPELFQDHIFQTEQFKIVGQVEIDNDLFIISSTNLTPYGTASLTNNNYKVYYNEIGYVAFNETSNTHVYTRVLRSKDLGFSPDYRVSGVGEKRNNGVSLYLTDNNAIPRAIYLKSPYSQDSALSVNGGEYNLNTIDEETKLFQTTSDSMINFIEVKSNSGILKCGNKRYTGYFLNAGEVPSEYLYPTNPIAIIPNKGANNIQIRGGDIDEISDKSVTLEVVNIPANVYEYFVLVVIEYQGEAFSIHKVKKYAIDQNQTSLSIDHTGFGDETETIVLEDVVTLYSKYTKVQNMKLFSNRMIISNLTEEVDQNLSVWAQSITHTLEQKKINSVGLMGINFTDSNPAYKYGEYQDPNNVYYYGSYMMNDTYRFGVQVKWKSSGKWSNPYWVDDIRFDTLSYNIINDVNISRRTANNLDTNLTQGLTGASTDPDVTLYTKAYYVKFGNINTAYVLPNGKTLKESIDGIRFVRAERIPEVLSCGIFNAGVGDGTISAIIPRDYISDFADLAVYHNTAFTPLTNGDKVLYYFSPDIYYGQNQYDYQSGDSLKLMGSYFMAGGNPGVDFIVSKATGSVFNHSFSDHTGYFRDQTATKYEYEDWTPTNVVELSGSNETTLGSYRVTKTVSNTNFRDVTHAFLMSTSTRQQVGDGGMDNVIYYGQIFRNKGANLKYPSNKAQTIYYGVGNFISIDQFSSDTLTSEVFGGDVFTQKTHIKLRIPNSKQSGAGSGYGFYSQNITNTQLISIQDHTLTDYGPGYKFPQYVDDQQTQITHAKGTFANGLLYWIENWDKVYNQNTYNGGYNISVDRVGNAGFDVNSTYDGKKPATIAWSQARIIGGSVDSYRIFMPLDFTDLDMSYGEIANHEVINNAIYTWQDKSFQRQYFNEGALVNPQSGADIVLGTGSFKGPRGQEISSIGCNKKWNIIKGNTINGKDSVYWFNDRLKKIVRFGQDGIRVLSDETLSSFLTQKINFLTNLKNPLTNYGVHTVWNDKYKEAIFTFKAIDSSIINYATVNGGTYTTGSLVINTNPLAPTHASGMSYVYQAKSNFTVTSDVFEPGVGADTAIYWNVLTPTTNPEYYTLCTLVYDELKNGFITKLTIWPNLWVPVRNTMYSVNPAERNKMYLHDVGAHGSFYGTNYSGYIESVMNYEPNISKNFEAIQVNSEVVPNRTDFFTKNHTTFNTNAEFDSREGYFYAPIRNDSTGTGIATNDTSRLWGSYLKTKITFQAGIYQKLFNYIVKFRVMPRLYNQ